MTSFSMAFSRSLDAQVAAEELAVRIDRELGGPERVAGGLVLATAATGKDAIEVVRLLSDRWPGASLFGTSFEGVLADGRIYRDEPALVVLAWPEGPLEPVPLIFSPGAQDVLQIAEDIIEASGRRELAVGDLVLLFPDALAFSQVERVLADLGPLLGQACLAGAAASGVDGHPAQAVFGDQAEPGALLGLFVPGSGQAEAPLVRCAGASRLASPWLEITACRPRWVDGLDAEASLDWVRRQLGLEGGAPVEPYLGRLLARVQRREAIPAVDQAHAYEERYVIGIDDRRGSFSLPGLFGRGDQLALALPDPESARDSLRAAIDALAETPFLLQFACRARDEAFYGDPDFESAWVAHHAADRRVLGTISPFQLAMSDGGAVCPTLVHSTVLAALGSHESER
jgi:small ligand-binding sensory domain FIST